MEKIDNLIQTSIIFAQKTKIQYEQIGNGDSVSVFFFCALDIRAFELHSAHMLPTRKIVHVLLIPTFACNR
jgi:hypothetical protein